MDQKIIQIITKYKPGTGYGLALFFLIIVLFSILFSSIIGLEREMRGHAAGLRTHVLICLGSTILMFASIYAIPICMAAFKDGSFPTELNGYDYDPSRIAAGIIGGFGFICAGTIIKTGFSIKGLTTSASLWVSGSIGLLTGAGLILEAIIATLVTIIVLIALIYVEKLFDQLSLKIQVKVKTDYDLNTYLNNLASDNDLTLKKVLDNVIVEDGISYQLYSIIFAYTSNRKLVNNVIKLIEINKDIEVINTVILKDKKEK